MTDGGRVPGAPTRRSGRRDGTRGAANQAGFDRARALQRLRAEEFDVLVVGGGITGAGVALDAASRGLRTALVEKNDFASGTSSKSSKMIHGGIRYLQQREIRLVYENLAERQRLLDNAPHLVSPLPFLVPLFGRDGVVAKAVARSYSWALWLYDVTGGVRIGTRHRRVTKAEALHHLPTLNAGRLVAGFLYFDARADDARLTLTVLRTAVLGHGAAAANYTPVVGFVTDERGRVTGARVRPKIRPAVTGSFGEAAEGPDFDIRARVVVNATGVWADELRALDEGVHADSIRPAKGVHVTVPSSKLPADIAAVIPVPKDRRAIFVVPWPEVDLVYLGTTDTSYTGPLDNPACTPEDVDYLLEAVNAATTSALTRQDVTGVWAGLRPLLAPPDDGRHVSERTSDLSRRHTVQTSPEGVVSVTGGKLTTYRRMAEDTVDQVVPLLGRKRSAGKCVTKKLRLLGAPEATSRATARPGVDRATLSHLLARYGSDAEAVLALADDRPELLEPVIEGLRYLGAEVVYAARAEMAQSLDDVLARRTRALIQDGRRSAAAAPAVADLVAAELGWTAEQATEQAAQFAAGALAELEAAGLGLAEPAEVDGRR
ncbi:MAG TPA: glycerol-3-phosphate dehydrogenase/oxidase [Acidimicrobiales bacterium]|nr:glycerol-3-phosphate dehydrogenase/oxidase [Acidimicrobiales bacterium]